MPPKAESADELALRVVTVYQDPLTRGWAMELWDRVGSLIGSGGISRIAWRLSDLARPDTLAEAVAAAARAHVVVVSFRDAGALPPNLGGWMEAWVRCRTAIGGALVALIGVQPGAYGQSGHAYGYLETAARRARLDFLPHERMVPHESRALAAPARRLPAGISAARP